MGQLGEVGTVGPITKNLTLFSSLCGLILVAHKTGSFLKPPAPPVQHEVRVEDGPSQPQPMMTISRSQSPLPPVDWKTYTSSGRKLRPLTSFSRMPRSGAPRETAPFLRYRGGGGQGCFPLWSPPSQRTPHPKRREQVFQECPYLNKTSGVQNQKHTHYLGII